MSQRAHLASTLASALTGVPLRKGRSERWILSLGRGSIKRTTCDLCDLRRSILRPKCCAAYRKASSSASSPSHWSRAVTTGMGPDFPFPSKTTMIMSWRQLHWRTNTRSACGSASFRADVVRSSSDSADSALCRSFSWSVRSSTGTYTAPQWGAAQTQARSLRQVSGKVCCYSTAAAWRPSNG